MTRAGTTTSIHDLVALGPLPREADATEEGLERHQAALARIAIPVTTDEAYLLMTIFGPDGDDSCFGLAWTLLHLIESCPGGVPLPEDRPRPDSHGWRLVVWDRSRRAGRV
jgi:hypothetical protein